MATTVYYNGVVLYNVKTVTWDQDVRYDESHTDAMFHVFNFRFEGLLHQEYHNTSNVSVAVGGPTVNMPVQYNNVQHTLMKSRGALIITVNDPVTGAEWEMFRCEPCLGDIASYGNTYNINSDVDNGPKPKSFRILQVVGGKCLRVAFEIECCKLICPSGVYASSGQSVALLPLVLNNRWSTEESMDENLFMTRTIAGKIRLSAATAATRIDHRHMGIPGLEHGFRRSSINFSVDKSGLECEYRVVDRQVHTSAPWPATRMNVRHTQSTNDGLSMSSEVHVELEGHPAADKKALFARAMQIIDAKLNFNAITSEYAKRYFPENISFTDYIGDSNRIEAVARFRETPDPDDINKTFNNLRANLGEPLKLPDDYGTYDPGKSVPPNIYGYIPPQGDYVAGTERRPSVLLLLQCYLQQPCIDAHRIIAEGTPSGDEEERESDKPYTPTEVNEQPPGYLPAAPGDEWSASAKSSVYTYVRACSRYTTDECRIQLPVASSSVSTRHSYVFRLGQSQCRRIIDYDAERAGDWPEVPPPKDEFTDQDLHGVLLHHWTEAHPPSLTADGVTRLYRVTTQLIYAMDRPPTNTEKYRVGVKPQTRYGKDDDEVKFNPDVVYSREDLEP